MQTKARWRLWVHSTAVIVAGAAACVSRAADPSPQPALEYVVRSFERYPLVALSEWHGSPETKNFALALIRQAGFADETTDIVVEFGNARYQGVVDRYASGGEVADEDMND